MTKLTFDQSPSEHETDIVIVGAGISGLYTALRLVEEDPDRTVTIVERLNRTGGRLDTDLIEFADDVVVREEEGGMRFNYDMTELMQLINKLGLCDQIVDFPMGSAGMTNRFHLRGRSFTKAEANATVNRIWGEIYDLNENERGLSPTQLVTKAFDLVLAENGDSNTPGRTPEDWTHLRNNYTWQGTTLNNWQMWSLLRSMNYSEECIQMLTETIGFAGPFKAPINAGDAFQILADFPKDPTYFTFRDGFSTLPNTVAERLTTEYGDRVTIRLSSNVDAIEREGDGFRFRITKAADDANSNPYIPDGETKYIRTHHTVLAVATAGMERLISTSPALNDHPLAHRLWESVHASRGMKLMKINLYFDSPWWGEKGIISPAVQFGPNFSSLPINAIYPFYALVDPDKTAEAPAALTIYCDFNNTNFWAGLQNLEPMFESPKQTEQNNKVPQTSFGASRALVDEAKRQLCTLFGTTTVPEPVLTSYRLWNGTDDFEYAYHQWRLGVNDIIVREFLANPMDGVYCCNEAISDMQGWVNGSLRSSNDALARLGVGPLDNDPCTKDDVSETADTPAALVRVTPGLWGS